jgi:YfiH family protein
VRQVEPRNAEPEYHSKQGLTWLTYRRLDFRGLAHGIVVIREALARSDDDQWSETLSHKVTQGLCLSPASLVVPQQIHSNTVKVVGSRGRRYPVACDGLITRESGVMITVSVADCIPLFAVNMTDRVLGLAHCGWRGITAGIVKRFVSKLGGGMRHPEETRYLIGPSIGICCYEVGRDLLDEFSRAEAKDFSRSRGGKTYFDLKSVVVSRLAGAGVGVSQISIDKTCTACKKYILCSYRGEGGNCGRMLGLLMLTE